uniref:Epsilon-sarcoglycan n=1 Tax=Hydra vulgaris TaxID=6087 RepID=T2MJ55_HYDVU
MLLTIYFMLCFSVSQTDGGLMLFAKTDELFYKVINKTMFFPGSKNIKFTVSINEMADMPQWLKLEQKESTSDAILYGTPSESGLITLDVIAWNKDTYETNRDEWILSIQKSDLNLTYQMEFKIKNKNLDEIFPLCNVFIKTVQRYWLNAKFISSLQKLSGHTVHKTGIIVVIRGNADPTNQFTLITSNCHSVPIYLQQMFYNDGFQVDWCALKIISLNVNLRKKVNYLLETVSFFDDSENAVLKKNIYNNTPASLSIDLVYVVLPFLFGILLAGFLTFAICTNSKYKMSTETWFEHKDFQKPKFNNIADKNITGFVYGELDEDNTDSRSSTPFQMNQYNSLPKYSHIKINGNINDSVL